MIVKSDNRTIDQSELKQIIGLFRDNLFKHYHSQCEVFPFTSMSSPIYVDLDMIKLREFELWYENSRYYDKETEKIMKSDDITKIMSKTGENYKGASTLDEIKSRILLSQYAKYMKDFEGDWGRLCSKHGERGHKEIKNNTLMDYNKVYSIIQNDVAYACQEQYKISKKK